MEQVDERHPEQFALLFPGFIAHFAAQVNVSCQRHYSKVLMHYLGAKPGAVRLEAYGKCSADQKEQLAEILFAWLVAPHTPVAVRVNVMDCLCFMVADFPWIREELKLQIAFFLRNGSAAMQSRGRKLLKKLR